MKDLVFFIVGLFLLTLVSCQKVIDLKVADSDPKMVIEALYNASEEEVWVRISKTKNVFSKEDNPIIKGAIVEIIDENDVVSQLIDNGDGTYSLENYTPQFNTTYTMRVKAEGETYLSKDYLMETVVLDTLETEYEPITPFGPGYVLYMRFQDPVGPNYYRAIQTVNDTLRDKIGDVYLFDDVLTDGNIQKMPLLSQMFQKGDTIDVDLISYSKKSFDYYVGLSSTVGGSTSSPAPANPPKDWSDENCYGHFTVYSYSSKSIKVK